LIPNLHDYPVHWIYYYKQQKKKKIKKLHLEYYGGKIITGTGGRGGRSENVIIKSSEMLGT
jgi:hypothetical protein